MKRISLLLILGIAVFVVWRIWPDSMPQFPIPAGTQNAGLRKIHFSQFDGSFRFAAELPSAWKGEYLPGIRAVNLYDPSAAGSSALEQSQIFIRTFEGDSFLTLSTVDILRRTPVTVGRHAAMEYEIRKKASVPNFAGQPSWRNALHEVVDIRLAPSGRTVFYVIAFRPGLDRKVHDAFRAGLRFDNDRENFAAPVSAPADRVTKKPFGIRISPEDSPVQPERFSGYHTGTDFEAVPGEEEVPVLALCGGPLRTRASTSGYGGYAVQECLLDAQPLRVVYGHIRLSSVTRKTGDYLVPGEQIAVLGEGFSPETDGERKHLHLSVRKGTEDIRGYVQSLSELASWLDPMSLISP